MADYWWVVAAVVLAFGYAVRGTPLARYWTRFVLMFIAIIVIPVAVVVVVVVIVIPVVDGIQHPDSWCPAPMHIEHVQPTSQLPDGVVCVR